MSGNDPYAGGQGNHPDGQNPSPNPGSNPGQQYPPPQQGSGQYPPPQQPGQPAYGQPAYGQPGGQPGYGQAPGQTYPPAGPTFNPTSGGGGYPPSTGGYGGPGGPGGPPSGGSKKGLWIILAAVAAFLVLLLVVVIALVASRGGDDASTASGGGSGSAKTDTQDAVVKSYLQAVAAGDAKKALSLVAQKPATTDFLTDAVLQESAKTAKITEINVPKVQSEYSSIVNASYNVGDESVSETFYVSKTADGYAVKEVGNDLDLSRLRANTLPLLINGKQVETDKVVLFPGVYTVTSGTPNVAYGETGTLTVKGGSDYVSTIDLQPTLTPAGEKAFTAAVRQSTLSCLKKKELSPKNCPNQAGASQTYKIDKASIKWKLKDSDAFANLKPRLDYDNPAMASVYPSLQMEITANCSSPSGRCSLNTYSRGDVKADMTKNPVAVTWED